MRLGYCYARNTPGSICQYKEDGRVKASLNVYVCVSTHAWHVMPKVSAQVYMLDRKIWKLFRPRGNRRKKDKIEISSSLQLPISLIFAIHVSFIIPLPMMWILLTKPMQKSLTTVCLHSSFVRLKNKHIGVLGTNVATIS